MLLLIKKTKDLTAGNQYDITALIVKYHQLFKLSFKGCCWVL